MLDSAKRRFSESQAEKAAGAASWWRVSRLLHIDQSSMETLDQFLMASLNLTGYLIKKNVNIYLCLIMLCQCCTQLLSLYDFGLCFLFRSNGKEHFG